MKSYVTTTTFGSDSVLFAGRIRDGTIVVERVGFAKRDSSNFAKWRFRKSGRVGEEGVEYRAMID